MSFLLLCRKNRVGLGPVPEGQPRWASKSRGVQIFLETFLFVYFILVLHLDPLEKNVLNDLDTFFLYILFLLVRCTCDTHV
jgi:hypothetical protein